MNTKMVMQEGASQGIVRCNLDPYDEVIEPEENAIKQAIQTNTFPQPENYHTEELIAGNWYIKDYYKSFGPITIGNVEIDGYNTVRFLYNDSNHIGNTDISQMSLVFNVRQSYYAEYEEVYDPETSETYKELIRILDTYHGFLRMETTTIYVFTTGKLIVSFTEAPYAYYYRVTFAIKVGTLWYNPNTRQWQQTYSDTDLRITVGWGQKYNIPIGNMTGTVMIYIYDLSSFGSWTVEYQAESTEAIDSSIKEIVHMKSTDKNFSLKKEIESKFALKENLIAMAKNFIFSPDLTPRTSLWTDLTMTATFNPLDRLATEIVEEMRNVGEILELDIRHSLIPGITPLTKFYIEWFDATYYPLSIAYDLYNDRDTIKFMKRLNSSSSS
jgi:hypothetical protein